MSQRKYKCPYCSYSGYREDLIEHITYNHEMLIPEGYSPRRIVFNLVNHREQGTCMICKGPTKWNEKMGKYDKICEKKSCIDKNRKVFEERMLKVHQTTCLLGNADRQEKMLAGRRIAGKYKYSTGEVFTYMGQNEKKLLEFEDSIGIKAKDILMPGPVLEYLYEGKKHMWITDQLIIPWALIIEVKDGGNNPNNRPMEAYRAKQVEKETMITELGTYNYIRLTNNQFEQLLAIFAELKMQMIDDSDDNKKTIIHINESANAAANAMPTANGCFIIPYGYKRCTFSGDDTEGFALGTDMLTDSIYVIENATIVKKPISFLRDRRYSIYKYLGECDVEELVDSMKDKEVDDAFFYQYLTDKPIISKDLLDFNENFQESHIEYIGDLIEASIATLNHRIMIESGADNEMYFPIKNPNMDAQKQDLVANHDNINVMKDLNGYFVINTDLNQRSKSYPSVPEIPKYVANIMANKDIEEV